MNLTIFMSLIEQPTFNEGEGLYFLLKKIYLSPIFIEQK
jgi:hypothetical protein